MPKDNLKPLKILVFSLGITLIIGFGAAIYLIATKTSSLSTASAGATPEKSTVSSPSLVCDTGTIALPLEGEVQRIEMNGGLAYVYYEPQGYAPALLEIWDVCKKERKFRLTHDKG